MAIKVLAVSVDGSDITRLAEFWADVLGQPVSPGATDGFAAIAIRVGLRLLFHQVPENKVVKNRVHLDLATTDYETETGRLMTLGAVRLHDFDTAPEGNEFALVASAV